MVTSRVEAPGDIFRFEENPSQGLVGALQHRRPRPADLRPAKTSERMVSQEVRLVIPLVDESIFKDRQERNACHQSNDDRDAQRGQIPARSIR